MTDLYTFMGEHPIVTVLPGVVRGGSYNGSIQIRLSGLQSALPIREHQISGLAYKSKHGRGRR